MNVLKEITNYQMFITCNSSKYKIDLLELKNHLQFYGFLENYLLVKKFKILHFNQNYYLDLSMFPNETIDTFVQLAIKNESHLGLSNLGSCFDFIYLHKLSNYLNNPYIIGKRISFFLNVISLDNGLLRSIKKPYPNEFSIDFPSIEYFIAPKIHNYQSLVFVPYYKNIITKMLKILFEINEDEEIHEKDIIIKCNHQYKLKHICINREPGKFVDNNYKYRYIIKISN